MQVENHKEEVPFEHYAALFREADAREMAARTGTKFDGEKFYVNLLGTVYAIAYPVCSVYICHCEERSDVAIRNTQGQSTDSHGHKCPRNDGEGVQDKPVALPVQTFLLRWLLEGKQAAWNGAWKTFREMPWGELYIKPYTGRVLTRAAFTFGTRVQKFRDACEKMDAVAVKHGDAGYQFQLLPGFWMQIMVWEGDEEFPPNAQVLYSDNFETGFAPEDRVVAGDILITAIKGNM